MNGGYSVAKVLALAGVVYGIDTIVVAQPPGVFGCAGGHHPCSCVYTFLGGGLNLLLLFGVACHERAVHDMQLS